MNIISHWIAQYRARRQHRRLVEEARNDWRIIQTYKIPCVWVGQEIRASYGKDEIPAGQWVLDAEENGLGDRKARIISSPEGWYTKEPTGKLWADLKEWEAMAERKSIPMKEIV